MPKQLISFQQKFAKPLAAGALLSTFFTGAASANPSGASVQSGSVNITGGAGSMSIQQFTDKAIVNWQNFGIGVGESVQFLQPSQLSTILNRVVGQDPTKILGQMSANGNVWIINPNGVLFGPQSQVNVGGLVASTLNITNQDFLNGNYRFTQDQNKALASVVNQGSITITDGGYAILMAPMVSNEGMIVANLGQVNLMSGESATLNFDGRNLISYDIGHMDNANPGTVVVDRDTVSALLANVIQDPNLTEAGGIVENPDGTVSLVNAADTVVNSGTIQANGADGQKAGKIVLDSGRLTVLGADSVTETSGVGADSDGGEVIALSHGTMKLEAGATLAAKGGDISGDGGFIDTSGYERIILDEYVDVSAVDGDAGTWLIDPEFLTIISGSGGAADTLPSPPDTSGITAQSSTISESFLEGVTSGTVILQANNQITINAIADGAITFQDGVSVEFQTNTGDLVFADRTNSVQVGGDAILTLDIGRDIYLGVVENSGTGETSISYGRDLYDGNGDANNIIGDFLTFDLSNGNLSVIDENAGMAGAKSAANANSLNIAGTAGAGSDPLSLTFNNVGVRNVDILSGGARNLDITGGTLTSDNFQTRPTDLTIDGVGNLNIGATTFDDVAITSTGTINGGGVLTANTATLSGTQIGNSTPVDASGVVVLDVEGTQNNAIINVNTGAPTTDLTVRSNNSRTTIDGNVVTVANTSYAGALAAINPDFVPPAGVADNFSTFAFNDAGLNFNFLESANRTLEIDGVVTAGGLTIQTGGSILDSLSANFTPDDRIQSDTISLIAGGRIGTFTYQKDTDASSAIPVPVNALEPIRVDNTAGTGGAVDLSVQTANGPVNIEHIQGGAGANVVQFNSDDIVTPPPIADLLNVTDPSADGQAWSSFSFTRTVGDIQLGTIGAAPPDQLATVSIVTLNGSIFDGQMDGNMGGVNVFADNITLNATGGGIGTATDEVEVQTGNLTTQSIGGATFVRNIGDLEVFNLITDGSQDSRVAASNGTLEFLAAGNVLSTTSPITDVNAGNQSGDTDGDGYDVTLNVTLSTGDLNVDGVSIDGNGGLENGADGRAEVNISTLDGSIVSNGGTDLTVGADTDVNLTASGGVGTRASQLGIDSTGNSPGELTVDANDNVGIDVGAGDFDVVTVRHNNADVSMTGSSGEIDSTGLDITGTAAVSTINYVNRTGDIPLNLVDANGSDINITALAGNVAGVVDGVDDIEAGSNVVTVNAAGDFTADASSNIPFVGSNPGSLEIGTVGGNVNLGNVNGLELNTVGTGNVSGDLTVDNDSSLRLGGVGFVGLTVGGDATFLNSAEVNLAPFGGQVDLAATNLTVTADGVDTVFQVETSISGSITIEDCIADGGGDADSILIANDGAFERLSITSDSSDLIIVNSDLAGGFAESVILQDGAISASNAEIVTVDIEEKTEDITAPVSGFFNNSEDVTINASGTGATLSGDYNVTNGPGMDRNLTLLADDDVNVTTTVQGTLDITSQAGTIQFADDQADGPDDLVVTTVAGQTVTGVWDGGTNPSDPGGLGNTGSTMFFDGGNDRLTITDQGMADTNVTFQSGTGDIEIDFAGVGDCDSGDLNDLTIIASDAAAGNILDQGDSGFSDATVVGVNLTNADVDLQANNLTLLAIGDIGQPTGTGNGNLEVEVCETTTARSDNGGVYLEEQSTVEHLIIDVFNSEYSYTFQEFGTGDSVSVDYTLGTGLGGENQITFSGGGVTPGTASGTDFTLIERDNQNVQINSTIDVSGNADPGNDEEFIRIVSGGSISNSSLTNVLIADDLDLIANTGDLGSAAFPIFSSVDNICVDVRGLNTDAFVVNDREIGNLYLAYNQDGSGTGDVNVVWDNGGTRGVNITNQLLSTQVSFTDSGPTTYTATNVDEANVVVSNGNFNLNGDFSANGVGNGDTFQRVNDNAMTDSISGGGDIIVGEYTAVDTNTLVDAGGTSVATRLELQARGANSGIFDDGDINTDIDLINGAVDADGNQSTLTLVAEGTNIGGGANGAIDLISSSANMVEVNAYAENQGNDTGEGDIQISATGGSVEYNEIYAGTDLEVIAPFHDPGFSPGGAQNFTPQVRTGSTTLTGDGEICLNDVRAGTNTVSDGGVDVTSTGAGDILVGRIEAAGDTVTINQADGDIQEKAGTEEDGNIFAQNFEANSTTGSIGNVTGGKDVGALDIVVDRSSLDVADGDVYIRNVGSIIWETVRVENSAGTALNPGEVYLLSEGVTTAGDVQVGITDEVDILIETRPGSDLLVGRVSAIGNTVALKSTGNIRADAQQFNPDPLNQADVAFADQGLIQADEALLLANGSIGTASATMQLLASTPGGTIVVAADTSGTATEGGGAPGNATAEGSVFLTGLAQTNIEIGAVSDVICNLDAVGIENAIDICVEAIDGSVNVEERVIADDDVQIAANGDVRLDGLVSARDDVGIEAGVNTVTGAFTGTGSIIDDNGASLNIEADRDGAETGDVVLRAQGSVGAASFDGNAANEDAIEVRAERLAGQASTGSFNVDDQAGGLTIGGNLTPATKTVAATNGVTAALDVCIETEGNLNVANNVTSTTEGVALRSVTGDVTLNDVVTAVDIISVEAGTGVGDDIIDNNGGNDLVTSGANGQVVLRAGGSVGTDANAIEIQAAQLAAFAQRGDINVTDTDNNDLEITTITSIKGGVVTTGVSAGDDVCIAVQNANLNVTSNVDAVDDVELLAEDDIVIGNGGGGSRVNAGDRASLQSNDGNIEDDNGAANAAVVAGNLIVLEAGDDISGDAVGAQPSNFEIDAPTLAVEAGDTASVLRRNGDVTITTGASAKGGADVEGFQADEICLEVLNGNLNIDDDITATAGDVAIIASGNITIGDNAGGTNAANTESVTSNAATGTVSIEAGGSINDDNNTSNGGPASISASNVVLEANGIGAINDDLSAAADRMAAQGGTGSVFVQDTTGNLIIDELTTLKGGDTITGVDADDDVCIDVQAGSLILDEAVNAGDGAAAGNSFVALRAQGDINFDGEDARVTADNKITIESTGGGLTNLNNNGTADLSTSQANGELVISVQDDVGTAAAALEIQTDLFAASAGDGVYVDDLTGNLTITELTLEKGGGNVTGVQAGDNVCIDVVAGDLTVERVVSGDDEVLLAAVGVLSNNIDSSVNANEDIVATDNSGTVILEANTIEDSFDDDMGGTGGGGGAVVANNVILVSEAGIGTTPIKVEVEAENLAATSRTSGDINIDENTAATTNITSLSYTDKDGNPQMVVGALTAQEFCLDTAGALNVNADIVSGTDAAAGASEAAILSVGTITINAQVRNNDTDTGNRISLHSRNGDIVDANAVGTAAADSNGGDVVLSATNGTIGTTDFNGPGPDAAFEIEANRLAAASGDDVNVVDLDTDLDGLDITALALAKGEGFVFGVIATNDICIDVVNSDLSIENDILSISGDIALRTQDDDNTGDGDITLDGVGPGGSVLANAGTASLESANRIEDTLDGFTNGVSGVNVVLSAENGIGTNGIDFEVVADTLAATSLTGGDVNIEVQSLSSTTVTVGSLNTLKGDDPVVGISAAENICLDVRGGGSLQINEDVVGGTAGAGSEVALRADGSITFGDGTDGQVRNDFASAGNRISLEAEGGDIVDNNATGTAAADANGGDVVLSAVNGTIGNTDFNSATTPDPVFEINASEFAAESGDDVNVIDLDTNADGLTITELALAKGGGDVTGVTAVNDICIDVVNENLEVFENITATNGSVALRTQDADGLLLPGSIQFSNGADVEASAVGQTVSVNAAGRIQDNTDGAGVLRATSVVLLADERIRSSTGAGGSGVEIEALNIAVESETENVDIEVTNPLGGTVNVVELDTLKVGETVTGVVAANDVCIDVATDNLQINEDVVGGTNGAVSEVAIRAGGSVTIGDGTNGQVRNDSVAAGNLLSIESVNGNIVDNNAMGTAAADANGGDVVLSAVNGTIGNTDFNSATTPDPVFEIDASRLAATSGDDINIVDLDTNADGLTIDSLDLAKGGGTIDGLTATNDICIDVVNGDLDVNEAITATNGSIALRTQDDDADDVANINLNGADVTAATANQTISLESAEQITDTDDAAGSLIADNVVMLADTGIGNASEIQIDALNVAAQTTTSGDVNISDGALSNTNVGFRSELLTTLKGEIDVDGIVAAEDICLDILGDLVVDENIVSRGDVAIRTDGNVQLGDNAGPTRGVIVAGTGADGMIGGGDDVTATVSIESGGSITDGNGDATTDGDGDGFADGGNIIALGDGVTDTGGNVVLQADGGIGSDAAGANADDIEIDTLVVAAAAGTGDVNLVEQDIVTNDGLTVGALTTEKGLTPVVGVTAGEDVCLEVVSGDLRVNEDIVSGTDAALGGSEVFLQASGDIIVGNGDGDQVRNADNDAGNELILFSQDGSLVDSNGNGVAATDANGGDLILSADNGTIGTTDFAGTATLFEIEANRLAASSGDDINVLDLDTDLDGLELNRNSFDEKDGTTRQIGGVLATNDICIDVVNGELDVRDNVISTSGSIALRTQDGDGNDDGNVLLNMVNGENVVAQTVGQTVSINSAVGIEDGVAAGGELRATNVVLLADTGIGDTGASDVQVQADNLAAQTLTSGDINITAQSFTGGVVNIEALDTLKSDTPVVGVNAAEDVCIDVINGDSLQINEDVIGGTAGAASEVAIRADGNITIGDGTDGQVRNAAANTANRLSLEAEGGDIIDNNAVGTAAADANGGDLVMSADGNIGTTDFAGNATLFEINANRVAATADNGDLNLLDLDTNADGLEVTSLALAKGGATINGLFAAEDLCLDVVNGDLDITAGVSADSGSLALRTQDADDATDGVEDGDINVNSAVVADATASVEAAGQITDGSAATSDRVEATNVVLLAEDGIGIGTELNVDAANLAAQSTVSGDVNIVVTNVLAGVVDVEELTTLKGGLTVTGINAAEDICLEVTTDALQINEDVISGSSGTASEVVILAGGTVTIGDGAADSDQIRNATPGGANFIRIRSLNGNIVDNNGDGVAATDANGGSVVLSAANGTIGTTDFAGTATLFEINAGVLAATSGDDVNIVDLDINADNLEIGQGALGKGGGVLSGVTAANDVCIDVVNGGINVNQAVIATNGSIAIRTQDNDGVGANGIVLRADVDAMAAGQTVSLDAAGRIFDDNNGAGVVRGTNVVLVSRSGTGITAAAGVGAEIEAENIAAQAVTGDVDLELTNPSGGTVTVTTLDTLKDPETVTGISAGLDICVDVAIDDLNINDNIQSDGGNIAIQTQDGSVTIGDGDGDSVNTDLAGGVVSIEADGNISDENGDGVAAVTTEDDGSVVLESATGSVTGTGTTGAFEVETGTVAGTAGATGTFVLDDLSGDLAVGTVTTLKGADIVDGVTAGADICIDVLAGDLAVNEDISSVTGNVALRANGNVVLGEDAGNTAGEVSGNTVGIAATNGSITDGNMDNNVTATDLVMTAGGGIGSDAAGGNEDGIETDVDNFAASAGTGDVNINEADGLTVIMVTDPLKGITATGITAATDVCVDVTTGDLFVLDNIQSDGGNVALQTQNGNVTIGDGDGDSVNTDLAGGVVSIESSGLILDENGGGTAAVTTEDDGSVVLEAGTSVNGTGLTGAFEVETGTVAGVANTGNFILDDLSGDLVVGTVDTLKTPTSIDGVRAGSDICIDVIAGNLNVNEDIMANNDVALRADGNVVLGEDGGNTLGVVSGTTVAIEATNGNITDSNMGTNVLATNLSMRAGGGIGSDAAGDNQDDIETNVDNFAANAGSGDVNIIEADGLVVTTVTDTLKGITETGVTAELDICIDVLFGDLDLQEQVTSNNGNIALRAQNGSINLNGSTLTSNAAGGVVSLESLGDIVDNNGNGAAAAVTQDDGSVVLVSGGSVIGDGAGGAFEVQTGTLAGRAGVSIDGMTTVSPDENFIVNDLTGDLVIGSVDTQKNPQLVDGVNASGDVCIEALGGNMNVDEDIIAGDELALRANGNIVLGDAAGNTFGEVTAGTTAGIAALNGDITDGNGDLVNNVTAQNLVMTATGGIGSDAAGANDDAIETNVDNFAADAGTGDVNIDEADGLTVTELTDGLKGIAAVGVTAEQDVCIDVLAGDLNINEDVTATAGNVALRAVENVVLGESGGTTTGNVSGATVGIAATNGNITDGNGVDGNVDATNLVMTAGGGIGSDAAGANEDAIETNVDNFAASATTGDVNIEEADGLTVTEVTDPLKGITAVGVTAGQDVCADVVLGDLNINDNIQSDGGNVALRAQAGNVVIGDGDGDSVNTDLAGGVVSIEASGNISDENGDSDAAVSTEDDGTVILSAGGSVTGTGTSGAFEVETGTVAGVATTGDFFLDDLSGDLEIGAANTLKGAVPVNGVTAAGDVCIDVLQGSLDVANAIGAGDDVALRANGSVTLGGAGFADGTVIAGIDAAEIGSVSVEALAGNIIDGNGDAPVTGDNIVALGDGVQSSGDVVLVASGGIGSDETGSDGSENNIEIDTFNFAASAGTGDVNVLETDSAGDGTVIAELTTGKDVAQTVTGVTAGDDVCIDVAFGDIIVAENITANAVNDATAGDVSLRTQGVFSSIFVGDNTSGVVAPDADAEVITANGNGSVVSFEATGFIVDDNGVGNAAVNTDSGTPDNGSVVFVGDSVFDSTTAGAFEVQTGTVAADLTPAVAIGDFLLDDLTGNLDIGEVTTGKGGVVVTGVSALNDVCIDVVVGDLDVNETVLGFGDVALRTGSKNGATETDEQDVRVNTGAAVVGLSSVSIEATGDIIDNNGAGSAAAATLGTLVFDGDSVRDTAGTGAFDIDAAALAARAIDGRVDVNDLDTNLNGLAIVQGTTGKGGELITGVTATEDVCIDVVNGALAVNADVTAGTDAALRTQDADMNDDGDVIFNNDAAVTAQTGKVSINVDDNIVDNNNQADNTASIVANTNVVISSGGTIGVAGAPLQIEAAGLAANSVNGEINIADLNGDLQLVEDTTIKTVVAIDGVTAPGDICIDVLDGNLDVAQQVASTDGNVALQASGSVTLSGTEDVSANRTTGTVSVEAGTEIIDNSTASFTGQNVVLESTTGVGNTNTVTIEADNFAADGGTGRVDIQDIAGGATVAELQTLKGGDTITGVTAAEDVCLDIIGGDLVIDEVVTAGTIAAIRSEGNIASNATVTGNQKVSVESGGNITDGLVGEGAGNENFAGSDVVIKATGDAGSAADDLDINSDRVAAMGANVHLEETQGDMNVTELELEKNGGTVTAITADDEICLVADDGTVTNTNLTISAGNTIAIRTRDTLVTGGHISTGLTGKVSIEVTDGGIQDVNDGFDIETGTAVIKANGDIGSRVNPIDTRVDTLAIESENGSVNIAESNGLAIKTGELEKGGGTVSGGRAAQDFNVIVNNGTLELENITAGNDVNLLVRNGDVLDCNADDSNIDAGGDVNITAPNGCVGEDGDLLEINAGGEVSIVEKNPDGDDNPAGNATFVPITVPTIGIDLNVLPPGVFAQDNVNLGESSFYLDNLYGWLEPEELQLIIDELEAYNYIDDGDFLLEKHPDGERKNDRDEDN